MFFFIFVNAIAKGFFFYFGRFSAVFFPQASNGGINLFKSTYTIPLVGGDNSGAKTRLVKSVEGSTSVNITEAHILW